VSAAEWVGAAGFQRGLGELGFRFANNDYDRLPELAADLVRRRVAVIFALGGDIVTLAAKAATSYGDHGLAPLPMPHRLVSSDVKS
jgi:hypothetical protein